MYELIHRIPHSPWKKPSKNEEQYFRRLELEHRVEEARRRRIEEERKAREREKEMYRNHCPDCGTMLEAMELAESQAKRCPECRGVWLDQEVFEAVVPREDHEEALSEMFRAMIDFSLGGISEIVPEGEAVAEAEEEEEESAPRPGYIGSAASILPTPRQGPF